MKFLLAALVLLLLWLLYRLLCMLVRLGLRLWRGGRRALRQRRERLRYVGAAPQMQALALAHPMALARVDRRYADPHWRTNDTEDLARMLGPVLLHVLGLRPGLDAAALRMAVTERLQRDWLRLDLEALRPQDDPLDALAFACARTAFCVRLAGLLGWLDEPLQWRLLGHNARRAAECFSGWQAYGEAWARGRSQWLAAARDDSLGVAFTQADVQAWLADRHHPWHALAWGEGAGTARA